MKNLNLKRFWVFLLLGLILSGCTFLSPEATHTPAPSLTPTVTLTATATATPTKTPLPTATHTPTLAPTLTFGAGELFEVDLAGFAFELPETPGNRDSFSVTLDVDSAALISPDGAVRVLVFTRVFESDIDLESSLQELMDSMDGAEFLNEPESVTVDGYSGLRVSYRQEMNGMDLVGEVFMVDLNGGRAMGIFAGALAEDSEERWRVEGAPFVDALLETIITYEPATGEPGSACPISTDPTYGYDPANPIKVGGDFLMGPSRERMYLNHLRGPEGEAVTYEREGSEAYENGILDIYRLEYAGLDDPIIVYVDMYDWEPPLAPVGFTCNGPFPLEAP